jgi:hypothetical protein
MNLIKQNSRKLIPPIIFFTLYLIIGLLIYKDFGVGWDEGVCTRLGIINCFEINKKLNYIIMPESKVDSLIIKSGYGEKINDLDAFIDKYYGSVNEIILLIPVVLLKSFDDSQKIILIRHLMIFLIFWISTLFFYKIIYDRYKKTILSIIGVCFLILSPRIFADSFYNSKDIMLLSFLIIALYFAIKFIELKHFKYALFASLAAGLTVDIRILGIFLPFLTVIFYFICNIYLKKDWKINSFCPLIFYLVSLIVFIYIFWPYLWGGNPFDKFAQALNHFKRFGFHPEVLYLGNIIDTNSLPWHYSLVWILITTPILYSILFMLALVFICKKSLTLFKSITEINYLKDLFYFFCFLLPILSIILLHSVLYNGWRQLFFIYPGFILTSIFGLNYLIDLLKKRKFLLNSVLATIFIFLALIFYQMIITHPYQMLYFNFLTGSSPEQYFDYDYWGLSYKEGFEKLLSLDSTSERIKVFKTEFLSRINSIRILDKNKRNRILLTEFSDSDYYIIEYSYFFNDINRFYNRYHITKDQEIDSLCVNNLKVLSIYKLNKDNYIDSSIKCFDINKYTSTGN